MHTYCRFDFSFNRAAQTSELEQVESIVNSIIAAQLPVDSEVVPLQQAMAVAGLRAVFGEVYPDPVRVISVGPKVLYSTDDQRCCSMHAWSTYLLLLSSQHHYHHYHYLHYYHHYHNHNHCCYDLLLSVRRRCKNWLPTPPTLNGWATRWSSAGGRTSRTPQRLSPSFC